MKTTYRSPILRGIYSIALFMFTLIALVGIYAPFISFSLPIAVKFNNQWYFPLFHALFSREYFSQPIDLFFNLMMFSLPLLLIIRLLFYLQWRRLWSLVFTLHILIFFCVSIYGYKHPGKGVEGSERYNKHVYDAFQGNDLSYMAKVSSWSFEKQFLSNYQQLLLLLDDLRRDINHNRIMHYLPQNFPANKVDTKYAMLDRQNHDSIDRINKWIESHQEQLNLIKQTPLNDRSKKEAALYQNYRLKKSKKKYLLDKQMWLSDEKNNITRIILPLNLYHWQEIESTHSAMNEYLPWWNLARINQKDLFSALIYGIRVSITVASIAVGLACLIGIPIGACAGYYGGFFDVITCRLMEVWESMPVFFVLLFAVSVLQTKSILVVISIIACFSWPSFSRFIRAETLKQKNLPYVELSKITGFSSLNIVFKQVLPNALSPLWSLIPFAMMAAISTEAALSFLGLGEEGSCSWGVLMDEGRQSFPVHSQLLWPPAIFLTLLLMSIALIGDRLRDQFDPRLQS